MVTKKTRYNEFQRLALKPKNKERYKFGIVVLSSLAIFSVWYLFINEKLFTIENLFILGIAIIAIIGVVYYYKQLNL